MVTPAGAQRWVMLGVLFTARLAMAFQFQSTAALSPFVGEAYGATLTDIGLLIGLYLAPGVVVAIPGGSLASRFGDVRIVRLSLGLMLLGALLPLVFPGWAAVTTGRVIAGVGGVIVNIVMTKMVVDWFTGREISTALAIFINSWPVGIALALLILPPVADAGGLPVADIVTLAVVGVSGAVFALVYRPAPRVIEEPQDGAGGDLATQLPVAALTLAGLIWAIYNVALAMVFSFGASALAELGWAPTRAAAMISAFMIAFSVAVPLGGVLADRSGRRDAVIAFSLAAYAVILSGLGTVPDWALAPMLLGAAVVFSLAAGPIMTLPSEVLSPAARAFGMGVFFTIYYAMMMVAPGLAGRLADWVGDATVVFPLGAALSAVCLLLLVLFRRARIRLHPPSPT